MIGRKLGDNEEAQATPIYLLKCEVGDRIGPTEIKVKLKRKHATDRNRGAPGSRVGRESWPARGAVLGDNVHFGWRTLADERYYLDTGGLDNIELGQYR